MRTRNRSVYLALLFVTGCFLAPAAYSEPFNRPGNELTKQILQRKDKTLRQQALDRAKTMLASETAAEKNDAQSQYYLGLLATKGEGIEKDPVAAHMWYSLSVRNSANERDAAYTQREIKKLEKHMTPEQITKAKEMAKSWKPQS